VPFLPNLRHCIYSCVACALRVADRVLGSQMARWNEDGSCAPTARVRSAKGEPFTLLLTKQEVEDDLNALDAALRRGSALPRAG